MGFFDSPCEIKCTDEVIDNGDLPRLGFLVCVGHFDAVNKFSENCRVKLMTAELQKIGTNINQIARRVNATGTIYAQDIEDIKGVLNEIWLSQRSILSKAP